MLSDGKRLKPKFESQSVSHSVMSNYVQPHGPHGLSQPARLLCPWNSPGKNTGVGCHLLLQGIFPTQVSYIAGGVFTTWITRDSPFTFTSLNHSKTFILSFTCSWGLDCLMVSFLAKPLNCIRCLLKNSIDHLKPPQNYPKFHRGIFYISLNVKTNGKAEEI